MNFRKLIVYFCYLGTLTAERSWRIQVTLAVKSFSVLMKMKKIKFQVIRINFKSGLKRFMAQSVLINRII